MDWLRGTCSTKELNAVVSKLMALESQPPQVVAKKRWIVSDTCAKCLLRTAKCAPLAQRDVKRSAGPRPAPKH